MTVVNSSDPELNGENCLKWRILNSCTSRWVSSPCGGGDEAGRDLRGRLRLLHGRRRVLLRCVTPRICPVSGLSLLVCHPFFRGEIGGWINSRFPCCVLLALSWNTTNEQMKIQVQISWVGQSTRSASTGILYIPSLLFFKFVPVARHLECSS